MQDSARYSCEATNVAGKTEKNYNLNVWGEFIFGVFAKLLYKNTFVLAKKLNLKVKSKI